MFCKYGGFKMTISKKNMKAFACAALCMLAQTDIEATRVNENPWQPHEDAALLAAVQSNEKNWQQAAGMIPGRTSTQCRDRWYSRFAPDFPHDPEHVNSDLRRSRWKSEEDAALKNAVQSNIPGAWDQVAAMVPGRTATQCRDRWHHCLNPDLIHGLWTQDEDTKLMEAVQEFGPKNWSQIAKSVPGRSDRQCKERWLNYLNLDPNRVPWTQEEDAFLLEKQRELGNSWETISWFFPGRSSAQVQNRWHNYLSKKQIRDDSVNGILPPQMPLDNQLNPQLDDLPPNFFDSSSDEKNLPTESFSPRPPFDELDDQFDFDRDTMWGDNW
jgi:hypothetical protein